eukprot:gnl/TRDRNA2_/TRDRNA2_191474_c0_seq1.p1 gnl/TRDRNA2_/TRDRNA2_191474_c0~~gnl/TRDRNA2_/TRDRNA2_191474_c0_seq1.p1  ORF type:complete len:156 (-),score=18.84 gnl/TRDRNA2_/TRDRNA2_191474_c0_seq1:73-495(-)
MADVADQGIRQRHAAENKESQPETGAALRNPKFKAKKRPEPPKQNNLAFIWLALFAYTGWSVSHFDMSPHKLIFFGGLIVMFAGYTVMKVEFWELLYFLYEDYNPLDKSARMPTAAWTRKNEKPSYEITSGNYSATGMRY